MNALVPQLDEGDEVTVSDDGGTDGEGFQISRAIHSLTPDLGYVCTLYLTAALRSNGTYEPRVSPAVSDFGMSLANWRRIQSESGLNSLRNVWI